MARDTARLLQAGASAEEIVSVALRHALPRAEWGLGHEMAVSADLLALSDGYDGLDKTLPLAHALSSCSEGRAIVGSAPCPSRRLQPPTERSLSTA